MDKKHLFYVLYGVVLAIVVNGIVYWDLFLESLDIFGIESLKNPEGRHGRIVSTTLVMTMVNLFAYWAAMRSSFKPAQYGPAGFAIAGCFILLYFAPTYLTKSNYYTPFVAERWHRNDDRLKMARQLIKSKELLGLTRQQVKQKLGEPLREDSHVEYDVSGSQVTLVLIMKDGHVNQAYIAVYD